MAREFHTILRSASIPWQENPTSRRYLTLMQQWIPTAIPFFNEWKTRPNCGHFYGGCGWYGEETVSPAFVFALAASSPEYSPAQTGCSRHALRQMAYKALRYLCFTHDTGPADCIRPETGLGRSDCCANKWGERGRGFFMESQCGVTLAEIAITALLLSDLLNDETWAMLERLFEDYAGRFTAMEPRSGVYLDTQMEENAWTSLGLSASGLMLGHHPQSERWLAAARRWMFLTATTPQDAKNLALWWDGKTIAEHVGKTFTTLPDFMAENHGIIHPTYTAAAMVFLLKLGVLYRLFSMPLPEEALFNRREVYSVLKSLTDRSGLMHPVQGMDWPYLRIAEPALPHAASALMFGDADGAYLEQCMLAHAEQVLASNEGRMYHRDIGEKVSNIQDPLIMWEYQCCDFAYAYAAHRLFGPAPQPANEMQFETAYQGVRVFPHSGFVFHRHPGGQTSVSWRNAIMALPLGQDGQFTIAPAANSILAQMQVQDRADNQRQLSVELESNPDCFALNLRTERFQASLSQRVLYASLPDGTSLLFEELDALQDIIVSELKQGFIRVVNEKFPMMTGNCQGYRVLYTPMGDKRFEGYVSTNPADDVVWQAERLPWLNIDDRMGVLYSTANPTHYLNRHYFSPWWAVADDLFLGYQKQPRAFRVGETIASLAAVLIPGQKHADTAQEQWQLMRSDGGQGAAVMARGFLAAANWGGRELVEPLTTSRPQTGYIPVPAGKTIISADGAAYLLPIKPYGAALRKLTAYIQVEGSAEVLCAETGELWVHNPGHVIARITTQEGRVLMLQPGQTGIV